MSTEGFEAADKEALFLSELAAVVQVQTGPIERISAFSSLKEHLVSFHYETCLCTCNYMSIKLKKSFSALRLSFTIDHKTCPGARGLRGKTRGGAGKTGGEEEKILNSQHFPKKIRRKRKKCRREKESRPEESAGVKHNKKLNMQILPMVKYWCFKILCLDHPKVVTV